MDDVVYELHGGRIATAVGLFANAAFDAAYIDAVFEGRQPGRVFVDHPDRPTAGLLCRTYDYFPAGRPAAALRQFIADAPAEAEVFAELYGYVPLEEEWTTALLGYVPLNPAWKQALLDDAGGRLETIPRRSFRYPADAGPPAVEPPAGVTLAAIDAALAARIDADLDEVIGLFWLGHDRFGAGGFGWCALVDGQIASAAYTAGLSLTEANLGVATGEAFRRRGLARLVCRACIAEAVARGLTPTWDCDQANLPSARLALALGFVETEPFTELAFPNRARPALSRGLWSAERSGEISVWRRRALDPSAWFRELSEATGSSAP